IVDGLAQPVAPGGRAWQGSILCCRQRAPRFWPARGRALEYRRGAWGRSARAEQTEGGRRAGGAMNRVSRRLPAGAALAGALLLLLPGPGVSAQGSDEDFHYHWRLGNLVGTVLGLFLPRQGDGELAFKMQKDGHLKGELLITSPESRE